MASDAHRPRQSPTQADGGGMTDLIAWRTRRLLPRPRKRGSRYWRPSAGRSQTPARSAASSTTCTSTAPRKRPSGTRPTTASLPRSGRPSSATGAGLARRRSCSRLAIDDHSSVSFAQVLGDETALNCVQFLRDAVAYYATIGVRIERVMTDNGVGYKNAFRAACDEMRIRHVRTRPYTPKTNGKVSASCRPVCASGPTSGPMKVQPTDKPRCSPSSTATTGLVHTLHSTISRP